MGFTEWSLSDVMNGVYPMYRMFFIQVQKSNGFKSDVNRIISDNNTYLFKSSDLLNITVYYLVLAMLTIQSFTFLEFVLLCLESSNMEIVQSCNVTFFFYGRIFPGRNLLRHVSPEYIVTSCTF